MPAGFRISPYAVLLLCLSGAAMIPAPSLAGEARVAVAANFKSVIDELEIAFEAQSHHDIITTSGATGKMYAQIVNGAPFDVFLAADQERPRRLEADGDTVAGSRFTYAVGRLALWDPNAASIGPDRLAGGNYRRLAIANPDLAPYGAAARQVITAFDLDDETDEKLVFGENIGQVFAFVRTENAELGFVALSQILATSAERRGAYWTPPQETHDPIRQDAVLLARGAENAAARAFIDFLKRDEAVAIIERFGYGTE